MKKTLSMKRVLTAAAVAACVLMLAVAVGCGGGSSSSQSGQGDEGNEGPSERTQQSAGNGLKMTVDRQTGDMEIARPKGGTAKTSNDAANENPWTIFVYLCGTDLESGQASATDDLIEMSSTSNNEGVRFVIEAGGTSEWQNETLDASEMQRFIIEDGEVVGIASLPLSNMGDSNTLADFLTWGVSNYPSEHAGVILWDHGGGSIAGVCADENFDGDMLSLKELDAALLGAYGNMDGKFDFIGFDACLMGTLETANVLASYADYMYASEEVEPGTGWDYEAISEFLAANPNASGAELGQTVCDSYFAFNQGGRDEGAVTLSVIDLSKADEVVTSFNTFSRDLCDAAGNTSTLTEIVRGVNSVDNYGGNNRSEGYTNMVDLSGLVEACKPYVASSSDVKAALTDAVVYSRAGSDHANAGGLSVYYPLMVQDASELAVFEQVCVSPYYLTFVDTLERTSVQDAQDMVFDADSWFENNSWEWSGDYNYDEDTGWYGYDSDSLNEEYWSYENESQQTGQSPLIEFAEKPGYDEEGYYGFVLTKKSLEYATAVSAYVYEIWDDGQVVELGETCDVNEDWETGSFSDNFDGCWLSLPDGQNLATYVAERTDDGVVYTSPILLNGEETNLRIRVDFEHRKAAVEGAWDGIDANGMSSRTVRIIQDGDIIVPQYYSAENDSDNTDLDGEEYQVEGELVVSFEPLQGYEYEYSFIIDDVYGDYLMTEPAVFEVDDEGNISYK